MQESPKRLIVAKYTDENICAVKMHIFTLYFENNPKLRNKINHMFVIIRKDNKIKLKIIKKSCVFSLSK